MSEQKTITLNFLHFLEHHLLGELDSVHVCYNDALLISSIDTEEQFVHVQFHKLEHLRNYDCKNPPLKVDIDGEELIKPIIWWKKAWNIHYPKIVAEKIKHFSDRRSANISSENIERVAKKLNAMTHMPMESCRIMAREMWKGDREALKLLNIFIEEV